LLDGVKGMKNSITLIAFCCLLGFNAQAKQSASSSGGSHAVRGHFKKDGGYVAPHRATNPNQTQKDNWSSMPNVNPYTGSRGTKEPQK
jgi:hypothetical protein